MILEEILYFKRVEVEAQKEQLSINTLSRMLNQSSLQLRSFKSSLLGDSIRLIAEVKKASPSKGLLCPDFNPVSLAQSYETAGAAAISVLTDRKFFQGSLQDLTAVKGHTAHVPVLRKDFIIDPYQLIEAKVAGADAVLLIVAALNKKAFQYLLTESVSIGLTPLVEVHQQVELDIALEAGAPIIGINNRDLKTFDVNLETTYQLVKSIPKGTIIVSESGIRNRQDVNHLQEIGVHAVLVGESIVTASDPGKQIRELLGKAS